MTRMLTPRRPAGFFPTGLLGREMEELWNRFLPVTVGEWPMTPEMVEPRVNLVETENQYEAAVELPGFKPEEFHVEVKNNELWLTGERKEEKEEKGKTFHRIERRYGEFRRVIPLPGEVNAAGATANFTEGVLTVRIPKAEISRPKTVAVEVKR